MPKQLSHKVIVLSLDAMTFEDFSKPVTCQGFHGSGNAARWRAISEASIRR